MNLFLKLSIATIFSKRTLNMSSYGFSYESFKTYHLSIVKTFLERRAIEKVRNATLNSAILQVQGV